MRMNMKTIKVLGTGCANCNKTMEMVENAVKETQTDFQVVKVSDPEQFMKYNVLSMPAVVLEEKVIHSGSVPKPEQIKGWLTS